MKNVIEYKGYVAEVEYDADSDRLFASVINMEKQGVHASGLSSKELKKNLKQAIDAHLQFCKEWDMPADPPFSGRITYRTSPKKHAQLSKYAISNGQGSINSLIEEAISYYTSHVLENRP